jgi:endogenous inhibitor of DNA gyrase (YacG/DUF329 family)
MAARPYDGAVAPDTIARSEQGPRCPTCRRPTPWARNAARPFCSVPCKLVDLGVWLDEAYRVAGAPLPTGPAAGADTAQGPA